MDDVGYLPHAYQLVTLNHLPVSRYSRTGGHENAIYEITERHHKQLAFSANLICFSMKLNSGTVSLKCGWGGGEGRKKGGGEIII